jgi:hypothetical protein
MKLDDALKTSLQELRMQMLGVQVLFGFQFQGLFQDHFNALPWAGRLSAGAGLALLVVVLGLLIAVPCQHRLTDAGNSTARVYLVSMRYATLALLPLAAAIGCDVLEATIEPFGRSLSMTLAVVTFLLATCAWYALGLILRLSGIVSPMVNDMQQTTTPLHSKIEEMLTEARVILPGAQALLGFQLIVMMTKAFEALPQSLRKVHLIALMSLALSVTLLISPAAVHRLTFNGQDDPRMHSIGSVLITAALLPLIIAISSDVWIAFARLFDLPSLSLAAAGSTLVVLLFLWYLLPLHLRRVRLASVGMQRRGLRRKPR